MKVFKDAQGREWCIDLNFSAIERIRAEAGVDLLDLDSIQKIDAVKIARAIAAACNGQLEKAGITAQQFIDGFDGDSIEAAGDCLWDEVTRFFPKRRREIIQKVTTATKNVLDRKLGEAEKLASGSDFESQVEKILKEKFGGSPESSESIPANSPGDSST